MKIAIVHDFLREFGGAERVVEVLHEIYPKAPIYTAFVDYASLGIHADRVRQWNVQTTWAQQIPFITKLFSPLRFLAPSFFKSFDLSEYDVIISSSNAYYAKAIVKKREGQIHICYCHTPPRSLYGYTTAMNWKKHWAVRWYGYFVNHYLRIQDFSMSQKPEVGKWGVDYFIANSQEVKRRIEKFYRRDATVIYPPVSIQKTQMISKSEKQKTRVSDSQELRVSEFSENYYLYVGRLTYSRHLDIVIQACNEEKKELLIVGKGAEEEKLRLLARETVTFKGTVSDEELVHLYQDCKAVMYPAEDEDFGIVPVEAMSFGKPVIGHASGGVLETVIEGKTGVFFSEFTSQAIIAAIRKLDRVEIDPKDCLVQANKFTKERFMKEIKALVDKKIRSI